MTQGDKKSSFMLLIYCSVSKGTEIIFVFLFSKITVLSADNSENKENYKKENKKHII